MTGCFIFSLLLNPKQVNTMVALFAVESFCFVLDFFFFFCCLVFAQAYIHMAMYSIKDAWNMTVLAPTIVSAVMLYSELLTGQKIWCINKRFCN